MNLESFRLLTLRTHSQIPVPKVNDHERPMVTNRLQLKTCLLRTIDTKYTALDEEYVTRRPHHFHSQTNIFFMLRFAPREDEDNVAMHDAERLFDSAILAGYMAKRFRRAVAVETGEIICGQDISVGTSISEVEHRHVYGECAAGFPDYGTTC
ncbi:hypothetical protein BU26DRAFT_249669 [Trematosphaeria pertusa]|uniref:Uncharacterized protein n=1 Tax=Trematosphaeria pertusa TaxID=390896 RepID=A0A6A6IQK1_9PLEO|nr:uncharacterized protein BU26DRAFT_249669 [Trematosphaeria pertusa]KAF2252052.1 hypothetical protein BU26DRAFT_249669 [Trematosphaeria pertusa]